MIAYSNGIAFDFPKERLAICDCTRLSIPTTNDHGYFRFYESGHEVTEKGFRTSEEMLRLVSMMCDAYLDHIEQGDLYPAGFDIDKALESIRANHI
jgi:hypothetical protein